MEGDKDNRSSLEEGEKESLNCPYSPTCQVALSEASCDPAAIFNPIFIGEKVLNCSVFHFPEGNELKVAVGSRAATERAARHLGERRGLFKKTRTIIQTRIVCTVEGYITQPTPQPYTKLCQ